MSNRFRLLLLAFCCTPLLLVAQLNVQWVGRYSTAGNNIDRAKAMVHDRQGNSCVTGTSWNGTNFDIVTAKFSPTGQLLWSVSYNGSGNDFDEARALAVDSSGNIIVTGTAAASASNYDIAVIKYDPAGNLLWDTTYNGPGNNYDEPYAVVTNAAGAIFITGGSAGTTSGADIVTLAYTPAGTQRWVTRYTGSGANIDGGRALTLDTLGNVFVAGTTRTNSANNQDVITLKYDSLGVQQWFVRYNGPGSVYDEGTAIAVTDSGYVFVCGYERALIGITNYDFVTLSYTPAGVLRWRQSHNGAGNENDRANAIALTPFGNVVITGRTLGTGSTVEDCTTIQYDAVSGTPEWINTFDGGAVNYDDGRQLVCDSTGKIYVTGYSFTTGQNNNYLLLRYDSLGNELSRTRFNGSGNNSDQAFSIAIDTLGNIFLGGMSRGAGTGEDYAVVKYCQLTAGAGTDTSICLGASVQLGATSSVGGIDSVWWTPSAGLSNPNSANPMATPLVSTCYVVHVRNIYGCVDADTVCVNLFPLSGPVITANGPTALCIGEQVVLTAQDTTGGPVSYLWNTGDTTQNITTDTAGTFIVTVTNSSTCQSQSQVSVIVNPLPTVSAGLDMGFCASTTVQLCATGAIDYTWSPAFGLSDTTIACPMAGPTQSTTYWVVGTDANGCLNSDSVTISLYPIPQVPVISQNVAVLTTTPAASYQWYFNNNLIVGATSQSYTPTQNGAYYVVITDTNGCTSFSSPFNLADVGVAEQDLPLLAVYPNPNTGTFVVLSARNGQGGVLEVLAADGRLVLTQRLAPAATTSEMITLPETAAGVYLLQIRLDDGTRSTQRLVIER